MASYREAIEWIAGHDDCYWIGDRDAHGLIMSVTACMVRDLWNKPDAKVIQDIKEVPEEDLPRPRRVTLKTPLPHPTPKLE